MPSFGNKYASHRKNAPYASDLTIRNWMVSQSLLDPIPISELLYWDDDETLVVVVQFSFFLQSCHNQLKTTKTSQI